MRAGPNFTGRVCPEGHICKWRTYKQSNRFCDGCEQEIVAGSVGHRCFLCDFDLCPSCSSNVSENNESGPGNVLVSASTNASAASGASESLTVPADVHISTPLLPPVNVFSIFKPRPRSITLETAVQAANHATQTTDGNNSTEVIGATSNPDDNLRPPPVLVSIPVAGRALNRLKLRNKTHSPLMPHATPTAAAFAAGTQASAELTSEAEVTVHATSRAGVTEMTSALVPTGLPLEPAAAESPSEVAMLSAPSPTGTTASTGTGFPLSFPRQLIGASSPPRGYASPPPASIAALPSRAKTTQSPDDSHVSELIASPDSPVSRLEAFRTMCRLHPDRKFGVSVGIQCSGPDPHFVDLRVPRTSDNFQFQLPPFGKRNEPTFENPCPVKVDRGWQSARSLGNMAFKKMEIFVQNAQVVRMPRDGSCLYHALIQHTNHVTGANLSILQLRRELVDFVLQHKDLVVHGQPLQQWIWWECHCR